MPLLLFSCSPTKHLKEDQYLLNRNTVIDKSTDIEKNEIKSYIKQKPNRKLFGLFRIHLGLYNLADEEKVKERRTEKDKRRIAKGKKPKNRLSLGEWLLTVGESPVIFDSSLTSRSVRQIQLLLNNKGYFESTVKDSVVYRNKTANVYYIIRAERPYRIRTISYNIEDKYLEQFVLSDTSYALLKSGDPYDVDVLQKERERITRSLNNDGFFYFSKEYIYYRVDSALNNKQLDITIGIKNWIPKGATSSDSLMETSHKRFYINNIYIQTDYNPTLPDKIPADTLLVNGYYILYNTSLQFKPHLLLNAVFIQKGGLYQLRDAEATYKRLAELRVFKFINILFQESSQEDYLNAYIQLTPAVKQAFTVETEGTNSGGNLGIAGSFTYQNKNILKGAEIFEFKIKGGIQAQKPLNSVKETGTQALIPFNTIEFGPEANLHVPRFLVPFRMRVAKNANPKTTFTNSIIFQQRPGYTRYIGTIAYGYSWRETSTKRHTINPVEINFVDVNNSPEFEADLEKSKNPLLQYSYTDHLVIDTRYSYLYNEQSIQAKSNFSYFKFNAELAGNLLRAFHNLTTASKDTNGSYRILQIPYAQYLRFDIDYRYYFQLNDHSKLVLRAAGGIGKPLHNLRVLPFEKSFFSGGANSMRAWRVRTLGPGSYKSSPDESFGQIGDGQLEGNIEYRFNIIKMLNGALFVDAGNIWLRNPDLNRPGGEFKLSSFYKEIGIGSGIGARVDFNFFIIRLDLGIKMHDPSFPLTERWVIKNLGNRNWKLNNRYSFFTVNLGIGYPF